MINSDALLLDLCQRCVVNVLSTIYQITNAKCGKPMKLNPEPPLQNLYIQFGLEGIQGNLNLYVSPSLIKFEDFDDGAAINRENREFADIAFGLLGELLNQLGGSMRNALIHNLDFQDLPPQGPQKTLTTPLIKEINNIPLVWPVEFKNSKLLFYTQFILNQSQKQNLIDKVKEKKFKDIPLFEGGELNMFF